ncbi:MAG TPA: Na+/H+ antiporter subunit E [Bryobacteraceae bacterium]|nr:Na+/H+ antiporter subunit E [Bryobacteraceae bacterium]
MILANVLLALAWAALNGQFSLQSLVTGLLLGHLVMRILARGEVLPASEVRRVDRAFLLLAYLAWQIVVANFRITRDVVSIHYRMRPGVIRLPLDVKTDGEILLLAAMINITPGSVALDVSADRSVMYVHVMNMLSPDDARKDIKEGFERRVLQLRGGERRSSAA